MIHTLSDRKTIHRRAVEGTELTPRIVYQKGREVWSHVGDIVDQITDWFFRVVNAEKRAELGNWNVDAMVPSTLILITGLKIIESTIEGNFVFQIYLICQIKYKNL